MTRSRPGRRTRPTPALPGMLLWFAMGLGALSDHGDRIRTHGTTFRAGEAEIWINGVNTPWDAWNDFGGRFNPEFWDVHFGELKLHGVNAARVWLSCDGGGGILLDASGIVEGASQAHWDHLESLFRLASKHRIYILATLTSFDHTKRGSPRYRAWRNCFESDEGIASLVTHYVIPLVTRFKENPWLFAIEPCNEIEWIHEKAEHGMIAKERLIRLVAAIACAMHAHSDILVTQGAAAIKWNSDLYDEGNWWSDASLQAQVDEPGAYLDFHSPHYYDWQLPWFGNPMRRTPTAYGLSGDKPAILAETSAKGSLGNTLEQDYRSALANGWRGVMAWTSNGVDAHGDLKDIGPATTAIWRDHPGLVHPLTPPDAGDGPPPAESARLSADAP